MAKIAKKARIFLPLVAVAALAGCGLVPLPAPPAPDGEASLDGLSPYVPYALGASWAWFEGKHLPGDPRLDGAPDGYARSGAVDWLPALAAQQERWLTLRLRVGVDFPGVKAIYFPRKSETRAIYLDGREVIDDDRIVFLAGDEKRIELLVLTQGKRPEALGELLAGFLIGSADSLHSAISSFFAVSMGLLGFAFLVAVFHLSQYLTRRKSKERLYLALFVMAIILHSILFGARGLVSGFMQLPADLDQRLAFLLFDGISVLGLLYLRRATSAAPSWLLRAYLAVASVCALTAVVPGNLYAYGEYLMIAAASAAGLYAVARLLNNLRFGDKDSLYIALGYAVVGAGLLAGRFLRDEPVVSAMVAPAGLLVFSLIEIVRVARGIAESFNSVEYLSGYLTQVSSSLARFIPQEFISFLDKSDLVEISLGDHVKKEMTIFFSDIRAFTQLSERLTPEENFNFINSYLSRMVPIIKDHGGFVDKYVGDAIMALFPDANGADGAVRTAIEMQRKMIEYNSHRAKCGYVPLAMGVGVHTGTLMLGIVGVDERMESTVISDAVNLASRLESITKAFNISLAISEQTFKSLEDPGSYLYRFIGKVKVRGKADPISVFEIFDGLDGKLLERKMKANTYFEQGMINYYQKSFSEALYYFKKVLEIMPEDGAANFYLNTCIMKTAN